MRIFHTALVTAYLLTLLACHSHKTELIATPTVSSTASTVSISPSGAIPADGATAATVAIKLVDTTGKALANTAVQIRVSGSGNNVSAPALTSASGTTTALVTSTVGETKTVVVLVGSTTLASQPTIQFTALTASAANSTIAVTPNPTIADGVSAANITVTLRSSSNTPLAATAVHLSIDQSVGFTLSATDGSTAADGTFIATIRSTRGIPVNVTAAAAGFALLGKVNFVVPQCAGTVLMSLVPAPAAGVEPQALVAQDFNGDQHIDVAMALMEGGVSVVLGNGDGTFGAPTFYATNPNGAAIASGDVTGDGIADLVSLQNGTDVSITVLPGASNGTFGTAVPTIPDDAPQALALGEFSGDALQDAVVTFQDNANVIIYTSTGDGNFVASAMVQAPANKGAVVTADFDQDGNRDIAVVADAQVSVFLGLGGQTFASAATYSVGTASALVAADINNDHAMDLLATGTSGAAQEWALINDGNGTFAVHGFGNITGKAATTADFDGDGNVDLAVTGLGTASLFIGAGDGNFTLANADYYLPNGSGIAAADVNGDGTPDLLAVAEAINSFEVVLWTPHSTAFPAFPGIPIAGGIMTVSDFNNDGYPDLALADPNINILLGTGDGNYLVTATELASSGVLAITASDFNGDRWPDLAFATPMPSLQLYLGNGDGTLNPNLATVDPNAPSYTSLTQGDLDGNGALDLVATNDGVAPTTVTVYLNDGNALFAAGVVLQGNDTSNASMAALADFNGDGHNDIALTDGSNNDIDIFINNGNGTFGPPRSAIAGAGDSYIALTTAFVDHDSFVDIVALSSAAGNSISVLLGHGDGTFQIAPTLGWLADSSVQIAPAVTDFNGDGNLDIIAADPAYDSLNVYLGHGDGTFEFPIIYPAGGSNPNPWAVADINADGWPDVVTADGLTQTLLHSACLADVQPEVDRGGQVPPTSCSAGAPSLVGLLALFWMGRRMSRRPIH